MEGEFKESISSFFLRFFLLPINIALLVPPVLSLTVPWEVYWVVHPIAAFGRQTWGG